MRSTSDLPIIINLNIAVILFKKLLTFFIRELFFIHLV